jgi:hypothetical protein
MARREAETCLFQFFLRLSESQQAGRENRYEGRETRFLWNRHVAQALPRGLPFNVAYQFQAKRSDQNNVAYIVAHIGQTSRLFMVI